MSTLFTGKPVHWLAVVHSTNLYAMNQVKNGKSADGSVYATHVQTQGRGQTGNKWLTRHRQNLTFSVVYEPLFLAATEQFYLNMAVCIAISNFLKKELNINAQVKWPNDIYVDYEKIAGILIENTLRGSNLSHTVIGVGLNVNQEVFDEEVKNPTSVKLLTGVDYVLEDLLERFLPFMEAEYLLLKARRFEDLYQRYISNLLFYMEERVFTANNEAFMGTITGINADGRLIINTRAGNRLFAFKEVAFVV